MNTPPLDHVCVIFALKRERRAFHRHFPIRQRFTGGPCWSALCGPAQPVLVIETGVGAGRMQSALDWLFASHRPSLVISAGYAGALHDDLHVGDTMLASHVIDASGGSWSVPWPSETAQRCRLLTMPHFIATPEEKRALARSEERRVGKECRL